MLPDILQLTGQSPQWRITWPQKSIVPRLKMLIIEILSFFIGLCFLWLISPPPSLCFKLMFICITNTGENPVIYENILIKHVSHRDKAKHPPTACSPSSGVRWSAAARRTFFEMFSYTYYLYTVYGVLLYITDTQNAFVHAYCIKYYHLATCFLLSPSLRNPCRYTWIYHILFNCCMVFHSYA